MTRSRNSRIALSAIIGGGQRILQIVATAVVMPLLLESLGPEGFGSWGAATSIAWAMGLATLGVAEVLITAVAVAMASGRRHEARDHVTAAFAITGTFAVIGLLACAAAASLVAPGANRNLYLIAVAAIAINTPLSLGIPLWVSIQKAHVSSIWETIQTVITTVGLVGLASLRPGAAWLVAVVYGGYLVANLGCVIHVLVAHPEIRPRRGPFVGPARTLLTKGFGYMLLQVSAVLSVYCDNIIAMGLLGPEASAKMAVALRLSVGALGVLYILAQPLWPAFAEAATLKQWDWMQKTLVRGTLVVGAVALLGSTLLIMFGGKALHFWLRGRLELEPALLIAIGGWIVVSGTLRVTISLMNALSVVKLQAWVSLASSVVAFALKFAFAPRFGVPGILWATTLANVVITGTCYGIWASRWRKCPAEVVVGPIDRPPGVI